MIKPWAVVLIALISIGCAPHVDHTASEVANDEPYVIELVNRLDSDVKRRYYSNSFECTNDFETVLLKIIRQGAKAEKPLALKIERDGVMLADAQKRLATLQSAAEPLADEDLLVHFFCNDKVQKELDDIDRLSNNLELVTALRRIQNRPDPLLIHVAQPKSLRAIPRKLPSFSVTLESADVEQIPVWVQLIPHFHGSRREASWRFEVTTPNGEILPVRANTNHFRIGGGIKSDGLLRFGESLDTTLHMGDFIEILKPGEYNVVIIYHPKLPIADITDPSELQNLIVFRSQSFKLTLENGPKLVLMSVPADRITALSLVAELPNEGVVKFVVGVYDDDDYDFVSPESPMGKILTMSWQAVPALLDSLSDETLSLHRKAWVLSLLYTITAEHELIPSVFEGAFPECHGQAGKNPQGGHVASQIIPQKQQLLVKKWQQFRDEFLDIRESNEE